MAFILLDENNTVIQKQGYFEEGFIEAPDSVVCGQIAFFSGFEITFENPAQEYN